MKNIWRTAVKLLAVGVLCGCAVVRTAEPVRIGLLAPFEGRYREVGYAALYAVQMALQERELADRIELLAVDDGGSDHTAAQRAQALCQDPRVIGVLALGYNATSEITQQAFDDLPVILIGSWASQRFSETVFLALPPDFSQMLTLPLGLDVTDAARYPFDDSEILIGGDVFALDQFRMLRTDLMSIMVASTSALPDAEFRARYAQMGQFVPEPNLTAAAAYDAALILLDALAPAATRAAVIGAFNAIFTGGYLPGLPIHTYQYGLDGHLVPVNGFIE